VNTAPRVDAPLLAPAEVDAIARRAALAPVLATRREVHDHHAGDWPSARLGRGIDFEEARPYTPGDDVRSMDWRSTARLGHPFVKIYREERQPTWHLVLDRGPAMRFGTRRRLKVAQAARVALWLAFQGVEQHAAVGATLWDRQDLLLPAGHGRAAALELVRAVTAPCPPDVAPADAHAAARESERERLRLLALLSTLPRGSRAWLLTDFGWLHEQHLGALARLAQSVDVQPVRITDPAEHALPDVGLVRMDDIALGRTRWIDAGRKAARTAFAQALAGRRAQQDALLARCGLRAIDIASDADDFERELRGHG
jgi:uncharacterized protein (DUF58 family)